MFNFRFQQKAFEELNAEEFRIIYFLNNALSMANKKNNTPYNDKLEMFNGYMMDKLGFKERMLQYHIKALEEKGFIEVKRPFGRNAAKHPNIITLIFDKNDAINCGLYEDTAKKDAINSAKKYAIDCTLNNSKKINNKYYSTIVGTSTGTENYEDNEDVYVSGLDVDSYDEVKACISFIPSDEVIENNSDELYQDSTSMNKSDTNSDIDVFNDKKENEMSDERNECNERNITSLPTAESDTIDLSPQPPSPLPYDYDNMSFNEFNERQNVLRGLIYHSKNQKELEEYNKELQQAFKYVDTHFKSKEKKDKWNDNFEKWSERTWKVLEKRFQTTF